MPKARSTKLSIITLITAISSFLAPGGASVRSGRGWTAWKMRLVILTIPSQSSRKVVYMAFLQALPTVNRRWGFKMCVVGKFNLDACIG